MKNIALVSLALLASTAARADEIRLDVPPIRLAPLFKCGPGFATYTVRSLSGAQGSGVRCVKFHGYKVIGDNIAGIYWYGEGRWGTAKYRHLGYTYENPNPFGGPSSVVPFAADISGNGENTSGKFYGLKFAAVNGTSTLRVSGDWNEEWTLEPNGESKLYRSTLSPVAHCGPHFDQLTVTDAADSTASGTGIRCLLRNSYYAMPSMFYGEGKWGATSYRHLGFLSGSSGAAGLATAADLCNMTGNFCGQTAFNGIRLTLQTSCFQNLKYRVTGNWNEHWTASSARLDCIR